jgi:ferredoxin
VAERVRGTRISYRLRVNPIRCDGSGLCAELFPERIRLDDWGYPIVQTTPLGPDLLPLAERAVRDCPRLALLLEVRGQER